MTKIIQYLVAFLAVVYFNIELISAQYEFEKNSKIDKYMNSISQTNDEFVFAYTSNTSTKRSVTSKLSVTKSSTPSLNELQTISKTEIEEEIIIEKWMTNINDDLWVTDSEEALEIESWMFISSNWLNKNSNNIPKSLLKYCPSAK